MGGVAILLCTSPGRTYCGTLPEQVLFPFAYVFFVNNACFGVVHGSSQSLALKGGQRVKKKKAHFFKILKMEMKMDFKILHEREKTRLLSEKGQSKWIMRLKREDLNL